MDVKAVSIIGKLSRVGSAADEELLYITTGTKTRLSSSTERLDVMHMLHAFNCQQFIIMRVSKLKQSANINSSGLGVPTCRRSLQPTRQKEG